MAFEQDDEYFAPDDREEILLCAWCKKVPAAIGSFFCKKCYKEVIGE